MDTDHPLADHRPKPGDVAPPCGQCGEPAITRILTPEVYLDRCAQHQLRGTPIPASSGYPYRYGEVEVWRFDSHDD